MILSLSIRFSKVIAFFFLSIFYAQLVIAGHMEMTGAMSLRHNQPFPMFFHSPEDNTGYGEGGAADPHRKTVKRLKRTIANTSKAASPSTSNWRPGALSPMLAPAQTFSGGPKQPEMEAFTSVNANNMVDLFSGDFSYNIPLLDVGGYPVNIAYRSGTSMDDDASWVGLGWSINPGSITRNMRGLPDDFDGGEDTITKTANILANKTWGVTTGGDFELMGLPILNLGGSIGMFHNTYQGWGSEVNFNVSLSAGEKSSFPLSGGLSLSDNSQQGLTITPSLSMQFNKHDVNTMGGFSWGANMSLPYNSRTGIKGIQLGLSDRQNSTTDKNVSYSGDWSTSISFAGPTYNPTINLPLTNYNYSFTAKVGGEIYLGHPSAFLRGYTSNEYVAPADTTLSLPAYGYMNFQDIGGNYSALTDFNREKQIPYRANPPIPHIAVPAYTYDVFTINGEGTGGMFRPYRGDIGFIADPVMQTKTESGAVSVDIGLGQNLHGGIDLNANFSTSKTGPWVSENTLQSVIGFQKNSGLYEGVYLRNPGEKSINDTAFYTAIGGDDVVNPVLYQPGGSSGPSIFATNTLTRSSGQKITGSTTLTAANSVRTGRDKRTEVITYLTASEASVVGLDKYIYHYAINQFGLKNCAIDTPVTNQGGGSGVIGYYWANQNLQGPTRIPPRLDPQIYFNWGTGSPTWANTPQTFIELDPTFRGSNYSARWLGSIKAPVTGRYSMATLSDDGVRLWLNDSLIISDWTNHYSTWDSTKLNLKGGELYNLRMEFFKSQGNSQAYLAWRPPGNITGFNANNNKDSILPKYFYQPIFSDTAQVNSFVTQENRVNSFRKANHISEIDVLNPDGRRYVYGIPVYNLNQQEVSFNVNTDSGNIQTGLTAYQSGVDNSTRNTEGKDGYYSRESIPAYAHSFLLTGILSPDYVDVTGDGISDDDIGDAVKFNYSKTAGMANPYGWRAPYITDSATYNEGFRSYTRDDQGHYIYGTKELWYLNSIESKTMIATFTLQQRSDLLGTDERGNKIDGSKGMCLKEINLYSKADFIAHNGPIGATPIKTVHFVYSYELCRGINAPVNDSGKLTLKEIWFSYNGNNKGVLNPYVFNYHPNNPNYKINCTDKWGTYKDPSMNPGATASSPINNAEYPYALQDSTQAAFNVGAWTLDSIQLPSGGAIKVNYESDDYAYVQNRRATQMLKLAGFSNSPTGTVSSQLYVSGQDQLYAFITVPYTPASNQDLYARYLSGLTKIYFKLYLQMPTDMWGSGYDYVPAYADPDTAAGNWYGIVNSNTIWVKLAGVNKTGDGSGTYSPLTETAINYLRLNLPSKAYPGSEVSDNLDIATGVKMLQAMAGNIQEAITGFDNTARSNGWVNRVDTARSYIRLDCPTMKKLGGGLRVKSVLIYDNWNAMTGQRQTVYGQTYDYTTTQTINGTPIVVSSGVAQWEPSVGAEENPFHLPIEYVDRASMLAPAAALYTEEPLGETFFPGASVGYSRVRVKSIHNGPNIPSSNGYSESTFYTSYDFPTIWDWSMLDNTTEKSYKPILGEFLRINALNYLTFSQGFKVELNDMNGKPRTEATYPQTDSLNPISYTENFYKVDNMNVQAKHLNNIVTTIDPYGNINTASTIGKDAELMTDMREQTTTSVGANVNLNSDMFLVGVFPVVIPSLLNLFQHEVNQFRSVAMTKVIHRYGIVDSVIHIDKGSKVTSSTLLYDAETGDPLLTSTQNEFNDPIYQFTYPSHWMYDGVGPAYQNVDAVLSNLTVTAGQITSGLSVPASTYLTAGDELYVTSKQTLIPNCVIAAALTATFSDTYKLWVIDSAIMDGGTPSLFLVDQYGTPFSGNDVSLKVVRSGHRNMSGSIGSITSLNNPLVSDGSGHYHLQFDSTTGVVQATANELQQVWKVEDNRRSDVQTACVVSSQDSLNAVTEGYACLRPLFNYLISQRKLFIPRWQNLSVRQLVDAANAWGAGIDTNACPILQSNMSYPFYTVTADSISAFYEAVVGNDLFDLKTVSGIPTNLYNLVSSSVSSTGPVVYKVPGIVVPALDTISLKMTPAYSLNLISSLGACPFYLDTLLDVDSTSADLLVENSLNVGGAQRNTVAALNFPLFNQIPYASTILSARLILQADTAGHIPGTYDSANSTNPVDSLGISLSKAPGWFPYLSLDTLLNQAYYSPWYSGVRNVTPFQNDTIDMTAYVNGYLNNTYLSSTFVLTQGSGGLTAGPPGAGSSTRGYGGVPPYLLSGYNNYYSTFYNERQADSTKWPSLQVTYVAPGSFLDTLGAVLTFNSTLSCNTVISRSCFSSITDTLVNPYQYGILGSFRPLDNYVYYASRSDSNTAQPTNIRKDGVITHFAPFWALQGGTWVPTYDSTRWVWNSQTTLYNRKGFEIENVNPLGVYNSGLYGYGLTLPTAVIQNARYQESAFEGFEDYGFITNTCDTVCPESRPFDFSAYSNYVSSSMPGISDSTAHTGLYSLRIPKGDTVSLAVAVAASPNLSLPSFTDTTSATGCGGYQFDGLKASANTVLPPFEPYAGKRMLFSAWVKEEDSCSCNPYTNDHIVIGYTSGSGGSSLTLSPSGNVIEGWQRYEAVLDIPANASGFILSLEASPSVVTYFDDIRLFPFNADMKSYVYNPHNLRLMAELDENNYATFYEYDNDGTLIRVKKETERGILTIKETHSALLKNN